MYSMGGRGLGTLATSTFGHWLLGGWASSSRSCRSHVRARDASALPSAPLVLFSPNKI